MKSPLKGKIVQSGIIYTALSFVTGGCNLIFQRILISALDGDSGEYGAFKTTAVFVTLLGLPLTMATQAVIHHIAHYQGTGNEARLNGLLAGCRSFLLKFTIVVSLLGVALIQPLSSYFDVPRASLTVSALISLLIALWSGYAGALAQGLGWFKRLALIGIGGVAAKLIFTLLITRRYPVAETGVIAVSIGALATAAVFFWWRDLFKAGERIAPWNRDFFRYMAVAGAAVMAQWCFMDGSTLVVGKYFAKADQDSYGVAITIAIGLHMAVGPLLSVLFAARSSERSSQSMEAPLRLLALYAAGLAVGAFVLFFVRDLCVLFMVKRASPETSAMIGRLAITMIFVGLIQALGMWSLASNWMKSTVLYGLLGATYWAVLLGVASQATPTLPHTVTPGANAGEFTIRFQSNTRIGATNYRILHQSEKNSGFTEVTNISGTQHTFQAATNQLAGPHQFKVVPALPPKTLLTIMPVAAAAGFVVMLAVWIVTLRRSRVVKQE